MSNNLFDLLIKIRNNEEINEEKRNDLANYLHFNLYKKIYFYTQEDYAMFEEIIKKVNYDVDKVAKLINLSYNIRNAVNLKNGNRVVQKPTMSYVNDLYDLLEKLNFDYMSYEERNSYTNLAFSRIMFRISRKEDNLNNEISILDFAKKICDKYEGENRNNYIYFVLKTLSMLDRGINELETKPQTIYLSKEIENFFEEADKLSFCMITDIVKEFYPTFGNDLFTIMKEFADSENIDISNFNDELTIHLMGLQVKEKYLNNGQEQIIGKIKKININTSSKVIEMFSELISKIDKNENINAGIKKSIVDNIESISKKYEEKEIEFVDEQLNLFIKNCEYYVNNLIIPNRDKNNYIDEIITNCLKNCKEFFIEYDGKKFKEIVDYIFEKTSLGSNDLVQISEKCSVLFKEADKNKLIEINELLKDFKKFIKNSVEDQKDLFNDDLFEKILINNPELLLKKETNLKEVIGFIKGEISLKKYGYPIDFKLDKDFFSYNFYNKIFNENYEVLFNASLDKLINNLYCIEAICKQSDINFRKLKMNEDMIYTLLKYDLSNEVNYVFVRLTSVFSKEDVRRIIQYNPNTLTIRDDDLDLLAEKCLLNKNDEYYFTKLLSSELYYFNRENFESKSKDEILNKDFKYVYLKNLENNTQFSAEEILTSGIVKSHNKCDELNSLCEIRENKEKEIKEFLEKIEKEEDIKVIAEHVSNIIEIYNDIYKNVPNISVKNKILDAVTPRMDNYRYKVEDYLEDRDSSNDLLKVYKLEITEGKKTKDYLKEFLDVEKINSESIKRKINDFLKELENEVIREAEQRKETEKKKIEEIQRNIDELNTKVKDLEDIVTIVNNNDEDSIDIGEMKKYITIEKLSAVKEEKLSFQEYIHRELDGKTVVLFDEDVSLEGLKDNAEAADTVERFLGEGEYSIANASYIDKYFRNAKHIEPYTINNKRAGIYSRREDRCRERVYFFSVENKFFKCFYVVKVDWKHDDHWNAGFTDDKTFNEKKEAAKKLSEEINKMSTVDEVIDFIKISREKYYETINPLVNKNKKNKK